MISGVRISRKHGNRPLPSPPQPGAERGGDKPRQERCERPAERDQPGEQQAQPRPRCIDEAGALAIERLVQPGKRLKLALGAVEHADMLDASGQCQAAGRAVGETAIVDALTHRPLRDQADDTQSFVGKHRRFQRAVDHQQIARRRGGNRAREHGDGDGRLHVLDVRSRIARRCPKPSSGRAPPISVGAGKRTGEGDDGAQRVDQSAAVRGVVCQTAGERLRVSAVTGKIECHGDIAVACQGQREWQHQLLGSGEAMGDHDQRSRIFALWAEYCYRGEAGKGPDHLEPARGIGEMPQPG